MFFAENIHRIMLSIQPEYMTVTLNKEKIPFATPIEYKVTIYVLSSHLYLVTTIYISQKYSLCERSYS